MKYGDIRRAVLSRVRMYSIAGVEIPASYNLQADELGRIPLLINEALFHILTAVRREKETVELTGGEAWHGMVRFPLPEDVYALPLGRVWVRRSGKLRPAPGCRLLGRQYLLAPSAGEYVAEYDRYPRLLPLDPAEEYEVDEPAEVLSAAICFAAAGLVMQEDEFAWAALHNEYESRLAALALPSVAEMDRTEDVYGFGGEGAEE